MTRAQLESITTNGLILHLKKQTDLSIAKTFTSTLNFHIRMKIQ